MSRKASVVLTLLAVCAGSASAQSFDNTGNKLLNGPYYFREVIYNLNTNFFAVAYGSISFNGNGSYSTSAVEGDTNAQQLVSYNVNGTYTLSASGFGYLSNSILNSRLYGLFSNGVFIGSATESGANDLFIATPISGQALGTLNGSYNIAYIDALAANAGVPFDALLQMSPNGGGNIGNVGINAYAGSGSTSQTISGVKYIASNNAFVLNFPTCNNCPNLIQGQEYLYSSPDGNLVFGGSPVGFDMFVGVRNNSSGNNFGGLYYMAGMSEDVSTFASNGSVGLGTYYGSFNAVSNGLIVGHQRFQENGAATGITYADSFPPGTNGTYNDTAIAFQFYGGNGGALQIGLGVGTNLGIALGVQAPNFSGGGVFLNPAGVVNSASSAPFTAGVSHGEYLTLTGTNLGPSGLTVASALPLPTTLGKVQVLINNIPAPIYYVSPTQLSVIVPYEIQESVGSVAQIQVVNNGSSSNVVTEFVNPTTPGVFTNPVGGLGYAAAEHSNFSLVTPNSPAQIGETITVYVTGLGDSFPTPADGAAAGRQSPTSNTITADVSGVSATVTYAGLTPQYPGLYQINMVVPTGLTAGDNILDVSGPDSYTSEALISIGGGNAAQPQARPATRTVPKNLKPHLLQRPAPLRFEQ